MPRAFLIKSRASFPVHGKKEDDSIGNESRENGQATEVSSSFTQDSPSVNDVTSCPAQISPANVVVKKSQLENVPNFIEQDIATEQQESSRSSTEFTESADNNAKAVIRVRKRIKRSYQQQPELEHSPKKIRKGQPKKTVEYYYEQQKNGKANENNGVYKTPVSKDDSRIEKNYTVEKRHYANEHSRYHSVEHANQSRGTSSDKFQTHRKQTKSFALQNDGKSLDRGKAPSTRKQSENKEHFDKNTGLDNVMIVEYHSMREQRENRLRNERNAQPIVTQRSYHRPPQTAPVVTANYVPSSPVTSSSAPVQLSPPPRTAVQTVQSQENVKAPESEAKVVYVPVYPVSQGPDGVIYEPIPNATPIMAKDTVQVRKVAQPGPQQPPAQPQHVPEQPRPAPMVQAVPQRQEVVMVSPPHPPHPEQKPRIEYRAYEPQMPQQLTAAPAPHTFQPHPQGHVIVQPQSAPPTTFAVAQVPQYTARPQPSHHQQYPPQNRQPPSQQHSYPPHQSPVSAPPPVSRGTDRQVYSYRPPVPQTYQEHPQHYAPYARPPQSAIYPQAYPERVIVQPVQPTHGPPPVSVQQPMYQRQERMSHGPPPRPPPLPSQPQHAEKPALPSPSYPQESANRLLTPRYTPEGPKHEPKFVYAPPPADFMHSPVYRVPNNDENTPVYQHDKVDRNNNKTGSKKRKSAFPAHAVLQNKTEQLTNLPSPVENNSRTPSPKETDLMCNERLVKSPHHPSPLNKSSLIITPPVSPTEGSEDKETVTVVVRDQGIQASPRNEQGERILEHTCYKKSSGHVRRDSCDEMYTEDGTVVVHIPGTDNNNNNNNNNSSTISSSVSKKQRHKKGNYRFLCKYCNKGFQWHSHLESHERTHTGEKPFKCPECDRAFCRADGLQCHMLVHNKKRPFKCPHCGKGFTDKIVLEKHIYSHTGVKPFKCEYCGRAFSDSLSIEKHLLVHTGTKPYKCPYCVRSFNDSQMLVRHIRSHTGEKPYKCKNCPMAFSKQSALIIHTRVHTGEKPYQCPHCIKSFSISGNLQRHILIHTGERPYKCSKCPKAFNNPSHLSRHISKLHAPQNGNASKDQVKYEQFQPDNESYFGYTNKLHDHEERIASEEYQSDEDSHDEPTSPEQAEYEQLQSNEAQQKDIASEEQVKYKQFHPNSDNYYRRQEVV